jgi:cyclohexadieny/prephenate dehydrogenase
VEEPDNKNIFEQVTIIGLGLIGSSIARALRDNDFAGTIVGCDQNELSVAYARSHKFIDTGTSDPKTAVKGSQLVILATPPSTLGTVTKQMAPGLRQGAIVMDTASVKQSAMDAIAVHLPTHAVFVPAHPIAGSEQSGIAAGRADLFKKKRVIVTPSDPLPDHLLQVINSFWTGMGARVEGMPAPLHDMVYAYVSHLPQLLSFAAAKTIGTHPPALESFLRLSKSNPALWIDIFSANKENIIKALDRYLDVISHIKNELSQAPEPKGGDNPTLVREVLFPRIAASCLVTTAMTAEKQAGFSFARYAGTGFADFISPAAGMPDENIEQISGHHEAVAAVLHKYGSTLKSLRTLIENQKWDDLLKTLKAQ